MNDEIEHDKHDTITIPPEAEEAGKNAAFEWIRTYLDAGTHADSLTDDELGEIVSAACLAMLEAWPKMSMHDRCKWSVMPDVPLIILPLTENQNDKG